MFPTHDNELVFRTYKELLQIDKEKYLIENR